MDMVERIARVLAGQHFSRNAEGAAPPGTAVAEIVDEEWPDYVNDAVAVLKTMREPDAAMRAVDYAANGAWERMIQTALGRHA
ncbi:hypothetical protein [Rhizorhapis suberifaciens]|uniref:Uncharacterized protein n=1 Tax=Rhizorhapis suberifaciens TaxID=13656 RepID=A0A840HTQ5_9SPHN|nr:hypothetical protein [Rhizorhapis suberifaciens]MBB4640980.1 hypothetical protein [Rhizorhapis suberifaciens]